jgi:hypothetical protein
LIDYIKNEKVDFKVTLDSKDGFVKNDLLKGEIEGITTEYLIVNQGCQHKMHPINGRVSILLFLNGNGKIEHEGNSFEFRNTTVFIPKEFCFFSIKAGDVLVAFLHITIQLKESDMMYLKTVANKLPYLLKYEDCKPYNESIKSEKTISRTIIPEDIIPRMCMGSVQTEGPDAVGAHKHPMLEQLFYGLENNNCVVHANEHNVDFGEHTLLHIPLGSNHGATVHKGRTLHYIWMDFFKNQDDMSYISDSHISIEK